MKDHQTACNTYEVMATSADEDFREQVDHLLSSRRDVTVRTTDNDHEVILSLLAGEVAIVILDLDLHPLNDGLGTLEILKKLRPSMPIIVVSADTSVSTGSRVVEKGVFYYLMKPVDSGELWDIVDNAIKLVDRARRRSC